MSKNVLTGLALFLLMGILPIQSSTQTIEKPKVIAINPGHFPTDALGGTGANGKDAKEYQLNLKMTEYISSEFKNDSRFKIIIPKNKTNFNANFSEEIFDNARINYVSQRMKLKFPYVPGSTPGGNPKITPPKFLKTIYSMRLVLEDIADLIIDPHHDAPDTTTSGKVKRGEILSDSGYSILISPYNDIYEHTKNLAILLADEFSKEQNVSTRIVNDSIPEFSKEIQENRMKLKKIGIGHRKLLPELGNYKIHANKPVIMVEYNFAQKVSIHDDKYFKKMAQATHRAILKYYNLDIYENMDDKFTLILKNSKTGYIIKPEQNRISDFVMKDVFSGMKGN